MSGKRIIVVGATGTVGGWGRLGGQCFLDYKVVCLRRFGPLFTKYVF
ncbi:MAG: hypothetical protein JRF25_13955 [Deltaproteobacteria bacterium]|nr:hypothetical protein [Deltaproteobacteria bacterium]